MTDRLRISGDAIITEDESTGDVTLDLEAIETERLYTDSIPTRIRLYQSDGTVYAVDGSTLIDSGSNATTVIQSAIDHIHSDFDSVPPTEASRIEGWIDGGMDTFDIDTQLIWKDGVGLRNLTLDCNGDTDMGGDFGWALRAMPTGAATKVSGIGAQNVSVINNGDSGGFRFQNVFWCLFVDIMGYNNAGNDITLQGCIAPRFIRPRSVDTSGSWGMKITDSSDFAGNLAQVWFGSFLNAGRAGIYINKEENTNINTDQNTIVGCNFRGNGDAITLANGAHNTRILYNWFEGGDNIDIGTSPFVSVTNDPTFTHIEGNKVQQIDVRNASRTKIVRNFPESNMVINIESNARATNLVDNDLDGGTLTDNGERTMWNSVIGGGPLGGIDLSSTQDTDVNEGDLARSNGTSSAPADVLAMFDGTDWVYMSRGGTVTPA